jgi:hypothetical protein
MFGFTEDDINSILSDFLIPAHENAIREWYNGYSFGDQIVYNPGQ